MGSAGLRSKVVTCSRQRKRNAEPAQAGQTLSQLLLRLLSHEPVHWTIRGFTDVGGQCSAQASLSCLEPNGHFMCLLLGSGQHVCIYVNYYWGHFTENFIRISYRILLYAFQTSINIYQHRLSFNVM